MELNEEHCIVEDAKREFYKTHKKGETFIHMICCQCPKCSPRF